MTSSVIPAKAGVRPTQKMDSGLRRNDGKKRSLNGFINLYKPYGLGSTDAVTAVKRLLRPEKIGHAGTLDPLAEGVLPLALGEATKTVPCLMDAQKVYEFTITFGEARATDDAEGEVVATSAHRPTLNDIQAMLPRFTGVLSQIPPAFSAIKVDGKRAYDLARSGEMVELKAREVTIYDFVIASASGHEVSAKQFSQPSGLLPQPEGLLAIAEQVTLLATCSKGTYIRSLARDMAQALGTVGYVSMLKRLRVGSFSADHAISLDFLQQIVHNPDSSGDSSLGGILLPLSLALDDIPALALDNAQSQRLRHGQSISYPARIEGDMAAAFEGETPVALCERHGALWKPKRVFNS